MSTIKRKFSFKSSALPGDTFEVVSFTGTEGLSRLYRFDITLLSGNYELDLEKVIHSRATLTILRDDGDIVFNGILSGFEQLGTSQEQTRYRAILTPAFWRQTLTHHNQIFLNKTMPQIIEAAMKDGGLTSLDYELRLTGTYEPHEYICQYNESHYSFISRLMEREGIYYYFEQGAQSEKVIVTDSALLHSVMEQGEKLYYSPISGLDETSREEVIKTLICSQKILPNKVVLKDYNYRKPSLELVAEHLVSERGIGDVFIYGEHFSTPEEGARLAKVRAEALTCRARQFQGESLVPYLRPGYIFNLAGHNRKDFNTTYLTTDITHSGDQAFMLTAGLGTTDSTRDSAAYYRNSFNAILSKSQFRPERTTEKPRISGTLNAHIDAAGSGKYAEVDDQGRYKVRLPFDLSDPLGGKASSWLRMAQPYAGSDHGMHFPLHKDTEVLLTFIDGDPDRPIIAAAVPNPLTPSPVTGANATQNRITTAGGNKFHMEDQAGGQRIQFETPHANTWFRMGTPNDPPPPDGHYVNEDGVWGHKFSTEGCFDVTAGGENKIILGEASDMVLGSRTDVTVINKNEVTLGLILEFAAGWKREFNAVAKHEFMPESMRIHANATQLAEMQTDLAEYKQSLYEKEVKVCEQKLNAKTDELEAITRKISANETQTSLCQNNSEMFGNLFQLTEEDHRLASAAMNLAAKKQEIIAERTALTEKLNSFTTARNEMSGKITRLHADEKVISGKSMLVGPLTIL